MIPINRPFLPPLEEYQEYLQAIWERNWLTNDGPLVQELESRLRDYLGVKDVLYVSSGTMALQIAIKATKLSGEVITTPFSYVATTSTLAWEGCKPVFVDINPETLNIDPEKIEEAITDQTTGILATHVFGNPCDVSKISEIARKYDLRVIYDAAHAFGSKLNEDSVFVAGDLSVTSCHATKLFHTVEGGLIISKHADLMQKIRFLRNFGHDGPGKFNGLGINGKNSEVHAAVGLCNLAFVNNILEKRKTDYELYVDLLSDQELKFVTSAPGSNYSYMPILFKSQSQCLTVMSALESKSTSWGKCFYSQELTSQSISMFNCDVSS